MNTNLHLAFKREVARLRKAVLVCDLSETARREGLSNRYRFFSATLHHHHQGEDTYLFATVRPNATTDEVQVLDDMDSEHTAMVDILDRLDKTFMGLGPDSDRQAIVNDLDGLREVLSEHGAHEEREGVPIVQKYLKEADYKAFMKFNRSTPESALVLPWMCDGADPQVVAKTWGMIPAPVRLFLKPISTRKYTKFSAACGV